MVGLLRFETATPDHTDHALELATISYQDAKRAIPFLPESDSLKPLLSKALSKLLQAGNGVAAMEDGILKGLICGYEIEDLFGTSKGIYCPLFGYMIHPSCHRSIEPALYTQAAEKWVREGILSHALTLYATDRKTIDQWFWMGFGLRCVDSIREVTPLLVSMGGYAVKKAVIDDLLLLRKVHGDHTRYYRQSPLFMPVGTEDPLQDLCEWMERENHHLWILYEDEQPLGYMRIQPDGESFISRHRSMMNITGAFVDPAQRKKGAGAFLLSEILQWLGDQGYSLCGVDFESFNTYGSGFWNRFFVPYTYTMVRRIDERILAISPDSEETRKSQGG